jgi:hypothetical protein
VVFVIAHWGNVIPTAGDKLMVGLGGWMKAIRNDLIRQRTIVTY